MTFCKHFMRSLFTLGYSRPGKGPYFHRLPPIAVEYHACTKCNSLHGGIYGKGPTHYFRSEGADSCYHRWEKITRDEFLDFAKAHFEAELKQVSGFFRQ